MANTPICPGRPPDTAHPNGRRSRGRETQAPVAGDCSPCWPSGCRPRHTWQPRLRRPGWCTGLHTAGVQGDGRGQAPAPRPGPVSSPCRRDGGSANASKSITILRLARISAAYEKEPTRSVAVMVARSSAVTSMATAHEASRPASFRTKVRSPRNRQWTSRRSVCGYCAARCLDHPEAFIFNGTQGQVTRAVIGGRLRPAGAGSCTGGARTSPASGPRPRSITTPRGRRTTPSRCFANRWTAPALRPCAGSFSTRIGEQIGVSYRHSPQLPARDDPARGRASDAVGMEGRRRGARPVLPRAIRA